MKTKAGLVLICLSLLPLVACDDDSSFDAQRQVGPNPVLPEPRQYLFPPMHLAKVVGWKKEQTPTVAEGLTIKPLATDLQHPRSLFVLPNGDVLVIESKSPGLDPIKRPKDIVTSWIESLVTSGGTHNVPSNRITLLRDFDGDGTPGVRTAFVDPLRSARRAAVTHCSSRCWSPSVAQLSRAAGIQLRSGGDREIAKQLAGHRLSADYGLPRRPTRSIHGILRQAGRGLVPSELIRPMPMRPLQDLCPDVS